MNFGVIGLGYGDEGKGITTDYLCSQYPDALVIRHSGGQQAGHTVELDGVRHVFSNFGSGTLRGNSTYLSKFVTIDPVGIVNEYKILENESVKDIVLFIDAGAPITTPYEKWFNVSVEAKNGFGTVGVGVGATWRREEAHFHLSFEDLFYPEIFEIKLEQIRQHFYRYKSGDLNEFLDACKLLRNIADITWGMPQPVNNFIFEGSQGLMLDKKFGFFPNVTRSNTGSKNILKLTGKFNPYIVTRPYETRHGNGPVTGIAFPENPFVDNIIETNVTNEYQGEFRKQMLNLDTLKYAIHKDKYLLTEYLTLVVTCTDHMKSYWLYHNDNTLTFKDRDSFLIYLRNNLPIDHLIYNTSPESKTFEKFF